MKKRSDVITELKGIVKADKHRWKDDAFDRAIDAALIALSESRPINQDAEITLVAGQRKYPLPDDCLAFIGTEWGTEPRFEAYDSAYPGVVPRIYMGNSPQGLMLEFSFAPRARYLAAYGSKLNYWYSIAHVLSEDDFTVLDADYDLFITRALAVLMKDLIASNVTNPVQLNKNMGSLPNNSTPVVAHAELMKLYKDMV